MRRILAGSGNPNKVKELDAFLRPLGVEVLSLSDLDERPPEVEESGSTFEENARLKALGYARATGLWTLADDSGLEVEALGGRPGIHSARFAGPRATDAENNARLLEEMRDVPDERRACRYVAVVVLASPEKVLLEARGHCPGVLLRSPRGTGGFGYDPLVLIPEAGRTFAEMTREEKGRISHRSRALAALAEDLERMIEES